MKLLTIAALAFTGIAHAQTSPVLNGSEAHASPVEGQLYLRSLKVTRLPLFHSLGTSGSFVVLEGTVTVRYLGRVEGGHLFYEAVFHDGVQVGAANVLIDDVGNVIWRR